MEEDSRSKLSAEALQAEQWLANKLESNWASHDLASLLTKETLLVKSLSIYTRISVSKS
jgi:hypothetical protein